MATPIVSGLVAELMGRDGTFFNWPEIPRALIMAGAIHHTAMPDGSLNADHEGVGTVVAKWSNRIMTSSSYGGYLYGVLGSPGNLEQTFAVSAGQNVRVVLAWSSHTSGSNLSKIDTLTADLDLFVRFPDGASRSSFSYDNSYEFVEYTPTSSGTVTVRISTPRFDSTMENYAVAWVKWTSP